MALGFQDCCNINSYFYLSDNPTFVSQNEVYFIITDDGNTFCAQYVNVPSLNYLPPTYSVLEMTQFTSCSTCLNYNPCPTVNPINQIGGGAVIAVNDCVCKTQFPLEVSCYTVNPTIPNPSGGIVGLTFGGGVPPYKLYKYVGGNYIQNSTSSTPQTNSPIYSNVVGGEYLMKLIDGNQQEVFLACTISTPAQLLTATFAKTNVNFYGASNGSVTFTLGGGTPPYFVTYNSTTTQLDNNSYSLSNLAAGTYTFQFSDSGEGSNYQQTTPTNVVITQPQELTWPNYLCLSISYCNSALQLFFNKTTQYQNLRPKYSLSTQSKTLIGVPTNQDFFIYFDDSDTIDKWTTGVNFINAQTIQSIFNEECAFNTFSFLTFNNNTQTPLTSLPQNGTWVPAPECLLISSLTTITTSTNSYCPVVIQATTTNSCGTGNGVVTINTLNGTPPFVYYKNSNSNGTNPIFNNLNAGTYQFYVIDSTNTASNTLAVTVGSTPIVQAGFNTNCVDFGLPSGNINSIITNFFSFNFNFINSVYTSGQLVISILFDRYIPTDSQVADPYSTVFLVPPENYNVNFPGSQDSLLSGSDEPYDYTPIIGQAQGQGFGLPQCDYSKYSTQYDLVSSQINFYNGIQTNGTVPIQYGIAGTYNDFNGTCPIVIKITVTAALQNLNLSAPQCYEIPSTLEIGATSFLFIDSDNSVGGTFGEYQFLTNNYPCSAQP